MDDHLLEYRKSLLSAREQSQGNYDKYLISLSGGALGTSFIFIRDFVQESTIQVQGCLVFSWILWTVAIALVLFSFFASRKALDKAISQVDQKKIYDGHPEGWWDRLTSTMNVIAGIAFILATASIIIFIMNNLRS